MPLWSSQRGPLHILQMVATRHSRPRFVISLLINSILTCRIRAASRRADFCHCDVLIFRQLHPLGRKEYHPISCPSLSKDGISYTFDHTFAYVLSCIIHGPRGQPFAICELTLAICNLHRRLLGARSALAFRPRRYWRASRQLWAPSSHSQLCQASAAVRPQATIRSSLSTRYVKVPPATSFACAFDKLYKHYCDNRMLPRLWLCMSANLQNNLRTCEDSASPPTTTLKSWPRIMRRSSGFRC